MSDLMLPLFVVEPFVFGVLLVMLRVAGALLGLPVLGNPAVPMTFRTLLLIWLSALTYIGIGMPAVPPMTDPFIAIPVLFGELLIGAVMGFAARMLLAIAETAGAIMGLSAGLGLASAIDPLTGARSNTIGQLLFVTALLLFVTVGGHAAVIGALFDSYRLFPIGDASALAGLLTNVIGSASSLFELAFRLASPIVVVALLVNIGMGLLVRVSPQLNLFAIGFLVVVGSGLLLLYEEAPAITGTFQDLMFGLREQLVQGRFVP